MYQYWFILELFAGGKNKKRGRQPSASRVMDRNSIKIKCLALVKPLTEKSDTEKSRAE
jgi:hypothetical protein